MHACRRRQPAILRAMTETYVSSIEAQIIGRVFTHDGSIHFVLDTDPQTGLARCSRRTEDGPGVCHVPMTAIRQILIDQGGIRHDELESEPADDEDD